MFAEDVDGFQDDLLEALIELGTDSVITENVTWRKAVAATSTDPYDEIPAMTYTDHVIPGYYVKHASPDELTQVGVDNKDAGKLLVVQKSFVEAGTVPESTDMFVLGGVAYEVLKIVPIALGGVDMFLQVYAVQARGSRQ